MCPTQWQKQQFPKEYWDKLRVIYDGIDRDFFKEGDSINGDISIKNRETSEEFSLKRNEIIISYATRGMEPLRCFSEFLRAVPLLTQMDKDIKIVIAGADRVAYSYKAPNKTGSWKEYELMNMDEETKKRIVFTGLLDWEDYRALLQRSNLHCYFSRPYVLSWSFIESAACGANIATNRMGGMLEVVEENSVHWVKVDNAEMLALSLTEAIADVKKAQLKQKFSLNDYLLAWQETINELILSRK